MKSLIVLFFVLLCIGIVSAGRIGDSCNYYSNGDAECDVANNIYCTGYSCQYVSDPTEWCVDADSNNLAVSGDVNARYRDYDGTWRNLLNQDECLNDNIFVSSCTASLCQIREATCIGTERVFETHQCDNCDNGACLSYSPPTVIGNPCNYYSNGDTECDPENGIYCVDYFCAEVTDTSIYCNDSDLNNLTVKGTVSTRSRQYNGEWTENSVNDGCLFGTSPITSCNGTSCRIQELTCIRTSSQYNNFNCSSCSDGACLSFDANTIGKACNYLDFKDTQCSPDQNIFCLGNKCNLFDGNVSAYCIDSDDLNYFQKGMINFSYRNLINGNIVSSVGYDYCIDENQLVEFKCMNLWPEINYAPQIISCDNGCYAGKCNTGNVSTGHCDNNIMDYDETGIDCGGGCPTCSINTLLPETVSDQELLEFITQWAQGLIDDTTMLELIEVWKNSS
ncbi:hypothetical protein KKG83_07460 [Candidatus Micrarchaeota archaeon]|nr:hypothetical protein [Candidatus Micrarchaeota archaeon]MBU2477277.1 hypothetical protein [Candidatus Micrarchaeota archaeon]